MVRDGKRPRAPATTRVIGWTSRELISVIHLDNTRFQRLAAKLGITPECCQVHNSVLGQLTNVWQISSP